MLAQSFLSDRFFGLLAEENGEILDKKPVSMAIDEVYSGKLTLEKTDD